MRPIDIPDEDEIVASSPGAAPIQGWHKVSDFVIDDRYQRPITKRGWANIRAIADNFQWKYFSPVVCSPVEGGKLAVIDGQHRLHAAALCGFREVPCIVTLLSFSEQASSFKAINANVTRVNPGLVARAASAAGEKWIADLMAVATKGGCSLQLTNKSTKEKRPGEIYAVTGFKAIVTPENSDTVSLALSRLINSKTFGANAKLWGSTTAIPFLVALINHPEALKQPDFSDFIDRFDTEEMLSGFNDENLQRLRNGDVSLSRRDYIQMQVDEAVKEAYGPEE